MSDKKPTTKVQAAGVGGAGAVVLVWVLGLFGIDMPAEVAASVSALIAVGAGYVKSDA